MLFEVAPQFICIVTDDINTTSTYQLGTTFSGCLAHVDHLYWMGSTYYFSPVQSQLLWTQMLISTLPVPKVSLPLEPLKKILQETELLQKFIGKRNCTLLEHSTVTTIAANKLMDVGINVQKHNSHSWWDFFFTQSPKARKLFSTLFNPLLISLILLLLLTIWNCYLSYRI